MNTEDQPFELDSIQRALFEKSARLYKMLRDAVIDQKFHPAHTKESKVITLSVLLLGFGRASVNDMLAMALFEIRELREQNLAMSKETTNKEESRVE